MRGTYKHLIWQADPTLYAPARYRKACAYDAFMPDPVAAIPLSLPGEIAGAISDAERAIAAINRTADLELLPLARLLLRSESIASSRVEGLRMDLRSLARADVRLSVGGKISGTAAEILANIDAMQLGVEQAATATELTFDHLNEIHRVLLQATAGARAGALRSVQNWIGGNDYNPCGADFVPPVPEAVSGLMADLVAFCNSEELPALAQAAIAHAQFETVHPFEDGNGRTGRALVQVLLRRRGLAPAYVPPISVVLATQRDRYIQGLIRFREGDVVGWLEQFAVASARAAEIASRFADRVKQLIHVWRERITEMTGARSDAAVWQLVEILPAQPVTTTALAVAATRRTKPAVINAIKQLATAGILVPAGDARRNQEWEAPEVLDLLADLDAGIS